MSAVQLWNWLEKYLQQIFRENIVFCSYSCKEVMDCFCSPYANYTTGAVNQYILLFFNFLGVSQCSLSCPEIWPRDYGDIAIQKGFGEYDFIIVGAGSAGSVLANRLSENPDWKILLLEAGGDPPMESAIPRLLSALAKTEYDWEYYIEPSQNYSIYSGLWPRGKMLGGSSSMNAMLYVRGIDDDYNNWEALGNPSWGWKNVLKYFKKSEGNHNPEIADAFGGYYHSKNGPMSVELFKSNESFNFDIIKAAQELGFKFIPDMNADEHIGFTFTQGTIKSGVRESAATAFLRPVMNRPNLHVVKYAHVLNLEINSRGVVSGVRFNLRGQRELKVSAKKEVILSAGAINSPQILMASGIGPANHLQSIGIPIIRNLQVGKNLQDHPYVPFIIKLDESKALPISAKDQMQSFISYLTERSEPLSTIGSMQTWGYVNIQDPIANRPDFQYNHLYFQKGQIDDIVSVLKMLGYVDAIVEIVAKEIQHSNILIVSPTLLTEKSRGEILLRSADPMHKPRIIANYLSENSDLTAIIKAIRLYLKFLTTKAFRSHEAKLFIIPISQCDALVFDSDKYWECYCRYMISTLYHPVGSVKMGPDSDPNSVVDHTLKVKGTKGLRVIDASIMPRIPRANTNAPTIMVAEKGADFIKRDWGSFY